MVTSVDSNIVLDITTGDPSAKALATQALKRANQDGAIVASVVAYAELAVSYRSGAELDALLLLLKITIDPLDQQTAFLAGRYHDEYRQRGGTRTRILPDFLIAAHAARRSDRLLTRDARFFGDHFPGLTAIHPKDL